LEAAASTIISASGVIESRKEGLNSRIDGVDKRRLNLEYRLGLVENKYRVQFSALDALISKLQSTGNFLAQQLANLPG
jgi:flagellar hook-associated protein 2